MSSTQAPSTSAPIPSAAPLSSAEIVINAGAFTLLEQRLAMAECRLVRTHRQMQVTWAISSLACLLAFTFGLSPQSRAQFGVTLTSLNTAVLALQAKTASMSVLTDPNTSEPTVRFSGVNVQVVSGSGSTDGTINGVGNLIIGYNETQGGGNDVRTGSHSLILGAYNNYSSYAGIVAGQYNAISGQYASISGGLNNTASANFTSVSGGMYNAASGYASSVSGGAHNTASNDYASVSGGNSNTASGGDASVSGGAYNTAGGNFASISGGYQRTASAQLGWSAGSQASGGFTSGNFSSP